MAGELTTSMSSVQQLICLAVSMPWLEVGQFSSLGCPEHRACMNWELEVQLSPKLRVFIGSSLACGHRWHRKDHWHCRKHMMQCWLQPKYWVGQGPFVGVLDYCSCYTEPYAKTNTRLGWLSQVYRCSITIALLTALRIAQDSPGKWYPWLAATPLGTTPACDALS